MSEADQFSEWMRRAQEGDQEAYGALVDALYDATRAYLSRLLFDTQLVEDCVQDCLLVLHRARATYDPKRPFNPWYFTIVRHRARDFMRRQKAAPALLRPIDGSLGSTPAPETRRDVERLLARLKPHYREALELTKLEGLTIGEAAAKAGVAEGTMKARVHRGLSKLSRLVHGEWTQC